MSYSSTTLSTQPSFINYRVLHFTFESAQYLNTWAGSADWHTRFKYLLNVLMLSYAMPHLGYWTGKQSIRNRRFGAEKNCRSAVVMNRV